MIESNYSDLLVVPFDGGLWRISQRNYDRSDLQNGFFACRSKLSADEERRKESHNIIEPSGR